MEHIWISQARSQYLGTQCRRHAAGHLLHPNLYQIFTQTSTDTTRIGKTTRRDTRGSLCHCHSSRLVECQSGLFWSSGRSLLHCALCESARLAQDGDCHQIGPQHSAALYHCVRCQLLSLVRDWHSQTQRLERDYSKYTRPRLWFGASITQTYLRQPRSRGSGGGQLRIGDTIRVESSHLFFGTCARASHRSRVIRIIKIHHNSLEYYLVQTKQSIRFLLVLVVSPEFTLPATNKAVAILVIIVFNF